MSPSHSAGRPRRQYRPWRAAHTRWPISVGGTYTLTPSLAGYSFVPATAKFTTLSATPTANFVAWPNPVVATMAPAFAGSTAAPKNFAAGEVVSVYGTNFCADTPAAANPTLPDRLGACMARVDNTPIRLYYASPGQINAVLPQTLAAGAHQLVVQRYTTTAYSQLAAQSDSLAFTVDRIAMSFVETAEGLAVQFPDGGFASAARPVRSGDTLTLYLTGIGKKAQTFAEGAAPARASAAVEQVRVTAQGVAATVSSPGVQPQSPGVDQINIVLPAYTLRAGERAITLDITATATGQTIRYTVPAQ